MIPARITSVFVLVAFTLSLQSVKATYRRHRMAVLPDTLVTPGDVLTSDTAIICHRKTSNIRSVTLAMHKFIFTEYGIPYRQHSKYEDDHLISLELGGSNSNKNRWPQPYPQAYEKDKVENWSHKMICAGKLNVLFVQHQIARDWTILDSMRINSK